MQQYTRDELVSRLKAIRSKGAYVVAAGAGSGLSAKSAEKGGADLLLVFNSGYYRMHGHGSFSGLLAFGNANDIAMELGTRYVLPVVREVPVICSVFGQDGTRVIARHLDKVMLEGFSGINNFPTMGLVDGDFRQQLELTGLGYDKEVEMVGIAARKNIFSMVYVFNEAEAQAMAEAGADCIIAHVGLTVGGLVGTTKSLTIEESGELTKQIMDAGTAKRKGIIWLAHGGPLATPKDFKEFLKFVPTIDGFVGASSMERIPTEQAIAGVVKDFKDIR
ncbi:phosphoenolpyruvate hydrolase family protein [Xanthobacteraceae bacterium Astr-EGSB]|uniref:phosphoenolpyruvate hydrolase family protein n=1 Tax=Astrobacterium formosum TaxID=3069710 RepID=UPI0027AFBBE1|nr:phosphoenolpyruvate hydrolase family protein [Xanthobacteraceae bacterium Astr-EGSB]